MLFAILKSHNGFFNVSRQCFVNKTMQCFQLSGQFGNKASSKINVFKESDWITAVQNPKPGNNVSKLLAVNQHTT